MEQNLTINYNYCNMLLHLTNYRIIIIIIRAKMTEARRLPSSHPLLCLLSVVTQPKKPITHFSILWRIEGWVHLGVQLVPKAICQSGFHIKHTTVQTGIWSNGPSTSHISLAC